MRLTISYFNPQKTDTMKTIIRITLLLLGASLAGIFASCAPETHHVYHHHYYDEPSFGGQQSVSGSGGSAESFEPVNSY